MVSPVSSFLETLGNYFSEHQIGVEQEEIVRKSREFNFVIVVSSQLGNLKYFVKAKNKKSVSDSDLSLAYTEGQNKKLPVLFLTSGKLTKKAKLYLENDLKGQMIVKQIE